MSARDAVNASIARDIERYMPTMLDAEYAVGVALFAKIKRSSKYANQARSKEPFPVRINGRTDDYIFSGNDNAYRPADLNLYVKANPGTQWERWVKVS